MVPATVAATLNVLCKVFRVGLDAHKARQNWALSTDELSTIVPFVSGAASFSGCSRPKEAGHRPGSSRSTWRSAHARSAPPTAATAREILLRAVNGVRSAFVLRNVKCGF